jgi:hypothetical protein
MDAVVTRKGKIEGQEITIGKTEGDRREIHRVKKRPSGALLYRPRPRSLTVSANQDAIC